MYLSVLRQDFNETITLSPYDPSWSGAYRRAASRIRTVLPGQFVTYSVKHIGSTSVRGMMGKPCVDIMLGLQQPKRLRYVISRLGSLGYESLGEVGLPGRWSLRMREGATTYYISIVALGGGRWRKNTVFKNVLKNDAKLAFEYMAAKSSAVKTADNTLFGYSDGKQEIIERIVRRGALLHSLYER